MQETSISAREIDARTLVERQCLLESRTRRTITKRPGHVAQIEAFRRSVRRPKQPFGRAAQVSRTRQIRLRRGSFRHRAILNQKNSCVRRNRGKKLLPAGRIKFELSVESQHKGKDTRTQMARKEPVRASREGYPYDFSTHAAITSRWISLVPS